MAIDISIVDRMVQRLEKAPSGTWYARTYDGSTIVYEDEITGYTGGPMPNEINDVYAAQRSAVLLGGRQVVSNTNPLTGGIDLTAGGEVITISGGGTVDATDTGFDIVLCAGQSNMAGRATIDAFADYIDARVFQYGVYQTDATTYQKIGLMTEPLKGLDGTLATGKTGPSPWFGRSLAGMLLPNRRVLLVNVAVGGTSLVGGTPTWNAGTPGGSSYENAIIHANAAIAAAKLVYPQSRFAGIIWIQGETDGDTSVSKAAYETALDSMIAGFRARITEASASWFVIGGMVPEAITNHAGYPAIRDAHIAVATALSKCVYVEGTAGYSSDNLHYTTHPGPRIVGYNLALAASTASADAAGVTIAPLNTSVPTISGSVSQGATLTAGSGAWANYPTSYAYQWKKGGVDIGGATASTYATVVGDIGSSISVSVTATNSAGSASATSAGTANITAGSTAYTFEADTVGAAPANTVTATGGFAVANTGAVGLTGKYLHSTSAFAGTTDVITLTNLNPAGADQTVTWRRGESGPQTRDGMILRAQAGGDAVGYAGAKAGYHFHVRSPSNQLLIYKLTTGAAVAQLGATFSHVANTATYYRASVIGTALLFEYSADGVTWNTAVSTTDSTFATSSHPIQYMNGFASSDMGSAYIDDVTLS